MARLRYDGGNWRAKHPAHRAAPGRLGIARALAVRLKSVLGRAQCGFKTGAAGILPFHGPACPPADTRACETAISTDSPLAEQKPRAEMLVRRKRSAASGGAIHHPAGECQKSGKTDSMRAIFWGKLLTPARHFHPNCQAFLTQTRPSERDEKWARCRTKPTLDFSSSLAQHRFAHAAGFSLHCSPGHGSGHCLVGELCSGSRTPG